MASPIRPGATPPPSDSQLVWKKGTPVFMGTLSEDMRYATPEQIKDAAQDATSDRREQGDNP